ncbi:MAG: hypothetical protein KC620_21090, partial [Myxococcales bacterium]|nr:hypothetical protein [Myxococcales bacterium]
MAGRFAVVILTILAVGCDDAVAPTAEVDRAAPEAVAPDAAPPDAAEADADVEDAAPLDATPRVDAAPALDAAPPDAAVDPEWWGAPIEAAERVWRWVDFPDT